MAETDVLSEVFVRRGINRIHVSPSCRLHLTSHVLISNFAMTLDTVIKHYEWELERISFSEEEQAHTDEWLPALMLAYNTSYHSTIATTPFELLFGVKPRLPSLPAPDIERHHYGESIAAERFQMLQQARKLAQQTAAEQGEKYKNQYDKLASPHKFEIGQKVWLSDTTSIGKNAKLTPNWIGPYQIIDINDTNAKLQIKNKQKVVNICK